MNPTIVEALKELIRTFLLGLIATLITILGVIAANIDTATGTFHVPWNVVLAILAVEAIVALKTAAASAVDKFLHANKIETPLDLKSLDGLKE